MKNNYWTFFRQTGKLLVVLCSVVCVKAFSQTPTPDPRFKTDILLILSHPDDETAISGQLARWVFDEGKKVSAVYTNRGQGGGNSYGKEQYHAMGAIREIEVRQALNAFGISHVWFLNGMDTPGQDVLHSLQNLPHGEALEKVIRYVRLTRPEIIITWLPLFSAGENHGDHQAAGVIATEAFDLSGDPTIFPAQLAYPREIQDINNFNEGLQPWQPKKLYFYSDREEPLKAPGPIFDIMTVSASKGKPYIELAAQLHVFHKTQGFVAEMAEEAIKTGEWETLKEWLDKFQLIFGKSVVDCDATGNVFDGVNNNPADFKRVSGFHKKEVQGVHLQLGGIFNFYRDFWQAHDLNHLAGFLEPEIAIAAGSYFHVPLLIQNGENKKITLKLNAVLPKGWEEVSGSREYSLEAGQTLPVQTFYVAPGEEKDGFQTLSWEIYQGRKKMDTVEMHVSLSDWTLPQ